MNALQAMNPPQGRIQIDLDRPDYDHIMIYFQLIPAFVVTPPQIFIFQADPEKKERRKVTILDNYAADHAQDGNTSAFEIEAITTDGNQVVTVLSQDRLGDGYQLEVEIAPPAPKPGQLSFNGELRIKLKSGEDLKVNLRGFYAQAVMMKAQQEQVSDPEQTQQGQMP
jgi:hypothetical protein